MYIVKLKRLEKMRAVKEEIINDVTVELFSKFILDSED